MLFFILDLCARVLYNLIIPVWVNDTRNSIGLFDADYHRIYEMDFNVSKLIEETDQSSAFGTFRMSIQSLARLISAHRPYMFSMKLPN